MEQADPWISAEAIAGKWCISSRRVRLLCAQGKILSCRKEDDRWLIDPLTPKPADGRSQRGARLSSEEISTFETLEARRRKTVRRLKGNLPQMKEYEQDYRCFVVQSVVVFKEYNFTKPEVEAVLGNHVLVGKSLSGQADVSNFVKTLQFIIDESGKRRRLEPKILREINSMLVYGCPDSNRVYRTTVEKATAALSRSLNAFREDKSYLFKRIVRLAFDIAIANPFSEKRLPTICVFVCYLLMTYGYPPVAIQPSLITKDYKQFEASKNIDHPVRRLTNAIQYAFSNWPMLTPAR